MDDFKVVTLFLVLGITTSTFKPVTSSYGVFQPPYFRIPTLHPAYTPYTYYDIPRVNLDGTTVPGAVYPSGLPTYPQSQVPTVYNYFRTPVYDFRYPAVPFYPGGRPIFPPPPRPPKPQDPSSTEKPKKDDGKDDDGIEKLDEKASKEKNKKAKEPEESEDATESNEDSVTVDALE